MDVRKGPDLLIIMGTSLKVHGLKKLVKEFAKVAHARKGPKTPGIVIFVNKTSPGSEWDGVIDYHVQGDTDSWTEKVVADWKKHKPADWEHQTTLVEGSSPFRISNGVVGGKFFTDTPLRRFLDTWSSNQEPQGKHSSKTGGSIFESSVNATFLAIKTEGLYVTLLGSRIQPVKTPDCCRASGLEDGRRRAEAPVHL